MRVAHVITRMIIGGAQENTLFNCLDLIRQHHDETLLITGPSLGREGSLLDANRAGELPIEIAPDLQRAIHPSKDWRAYKQITKLLRDFAPDVVHTHSAKGGFLGRLAAWNLGIPCVIHTIHGAPFYPYQNPLARNLYRWCEKYAAKRCHRLISVADAMTDIMTQAGVAEPEKFVTIYSGMEVEPLLEARRLHRDSMRRRFGFTDQHTVFIKIARLFHLKGHEDVIRAAKQVVSNFPNARWLFVGDGILRESLEVKLRDEGLSEHFVFTGLVNPEEIPAHIAAADVLVHASYREGLARALPQALLTGIPAISYDVDGAREVVLDEITGYLVKPADIAGLASAMEKLAEAPEKRQRMGSEGQGRFTDRFRHETMTAQIRDLYTQTLASQ